MVALLLALAPVAPPAPDTAGPAGLMDEIESRIRLPMHSYKFEDYVRYYTIDAAGDVVGRFVLPRRFTPRPGQACEELDEKGAWRKVKCAATISWPRDGVSGRRYWVANVMALPGILDGGCSVVNVRRDSKTGAVTAYCNGLA